MLSDRESTYEWEPDGDPVIDAIADASNVGQDIAEDVQSLLSERYFDLEAAKIGEETAFDDELLAPTEF